MKMKKKIWLTILVVVVLGAVGAGVYFVKSYNNSEKGLTKKYYAEIKESLPLDEKRTLIKLIKSDFNLDNVEDYIGITGIEKHSDESNSINSKINSTLELYQNVEIVYIDGKSKELKNYASEMSFYPEVKLETKNDDKNRYIFVSDESSGNVVLLILRENNLVNIVKDSIQSDFNGYTINVTFDAENSSKIKIKLDNYARSYLTAVNDEMPLEFEDKNINKDNYRATYLANKFCKYKLEDIDNDNRLELIGIQNVLYLIDADSNTDMEKTAGVLETTFKIDDNNKLVYNKVEVKQK